MPMYKTLKSKKRSFKPKRSIKKAKPSHKSGQIHRFKQIVSGANMDFNNEYITQSLSAETHTVFTFRLADLDQRSTFQALFKEYRIDKIQLRLYPTITNSAQVHTASGSSTTYPKFGMTYIAVDQSDRDVLNVSASALRQFDNCIQRATIGSSRPIVVTFKPKAITMLDISGSNVSPTGLKSSPWIATYGEQFENVYHLGVKMCIEAVEGEGSTTAVQSYRVDATYYMSFRNLK